MAVRRTGEQPYVYVDCVLRAYPAGLGELHHMAVKHVSRSMRGEASLSFSCSGKKTPPVYHYNLHVTCGGVFFFSPPWLSITWQFTLCL